MGGELYDKHLIQTFLLLYILQLLILTYYNNITVKLKIDQLLQNRYNHMFYNNLNHQELAFLKILHIIELQFLWKLHHYIRRSNLEQQKLKWFLLRKAKQYIQLSIEVGKRKLKKLQLQFPFHKVAITNSMIKYIFTFFTSVIKLAN